MSKHETQSFRERVIIALDTSELKMARKLIHGLKDLIQMFKIGSQLFTACGPKSVSVVREAGFDVFLDLKFHDIPNTVAQSAREAVRLGVFMFNVHVSGGLQMMQEACVASADEARKRNLTPPKLIGVTLLTSLNQEDVNKQIGIPKSVEDTVLHFSELAQKAGLDGVVASPKEVQKIREKLGPSFLIVTPGIRPAGSERGDQERVTTPEEAFRLGSDYIVIGRPVTEAPDPREAVLQIFKEFS